LILGGSQESPYYLVPYSQFTIEGNKILLEVQNSSMIQEIKSFFLEDVFYSLSDEQSSELRSTGQLYGLQLDVYGDEISSNIEEQIALVKSENLLTRNYILGSDPFGRDMLSRMMAGSYVTLLVGVSSVLIALFIGLFIGVVAGYFGGFLDRVLLWLMNVFWSVPAILLVISIALIFGQGVMSLVLGIGLILWVEMAQVIRNEVSNLSQKEYVKAARLMGLSDFRILYHHILPNLTGVILVLAVGNFAQAILLEAGLNFLGVGITLPSPSWGGMVRELYGFLITDGAFMALIPCVSIVVLVSCAVILSSELKRQFNLKQGLTYKRG
jgi:peptide/nickel transport system permease protein